METKEYRISFNQLNDHVQTNCIRNITLPLNIDQFTGVCLGIVVSQRYYKPHPMICKDVMIERVGRLNNGTIYYDILPDNYIDYIYDMKYKLYIGDYGFYDLRNPEKVASDPNLFEKLLKIWSPGAVITKPYVSIVTFMRRDKVLYYVFQTDNLDFVQGFIGYLQWNNINPKENLLYLFHNGVLQPINIPNQ